jgi:uracil-DNA glycosylase family 4
VSVRVPPSGDPAAPLWIIGEAPGQAESVAGAPFVGPSGTLLRRFLLQVGIDPATCYIDNLWPERVPSDRLSRLYKDGRPNNDLALRTLDLLYLASQHKPNLILCLGALPAQAFTNCLTWDPKTRSFTGIGDYRGSLLEGPAGIKILPTFHPAYILRNYADHGIFLADLTKAATERGFPEIRRKSRELIPNPVGAKLAEVKERLLDTPKDGVITLDIEYIGTRLLCVGLTNDSSWGTSIATDTVTGLETVREIVLSGRGLNMQNSMFDCSILEWHYDMPVIKHLVYDTMLAAHAINIELPKGLDFLCSIYTDQPYYKSMVDWNAIKKGKQSLDILYEYNCIDAWTQHEIMEKQIKEDFSERPDKRKVFDFEMSLLRPLWEMSKRGLLIDQERLSEFRDRVNTELELLELGLSIHAGGQEFNVKSGDQVAWLLFDCFGLKPGGRTPKGKPKTDDKTLASILGRVHDSKVAAVIGMIREARKLRDTLSKFINVELDDDGRSRGMYNPGGTTTGRLASKKFYPTGKGHQQQNIPRNSRFVFVPDSGLLFGSVDYERAESLVVAHYTNDTLMLDHHAPGADAHTLLASLFFKKDPADISKEERYIMKQTRHAGNYMEGPVTFMRSVNQKSVDTGVSITNSQANEFINWYRDIHQGLRPWWQRVRDTVYRKKELVSMLGRSRTFYDRIDAVLPTAIAFGPQSTVGDLMNVGLLNLSGIVCDISKERLDWWEEIPEIGEELRGLGFQLLNQVHDSVGFQFPPEHETRVRELIAKCLHIPLVAPLTFETFYVGQDLKVGKSWGEAD